MKRQIEYPKLLLRLQELSDVLPDLSPEEAFRGIKGMDLKPHDTLIRECNGFQYSINRLMEDCRSEVEKPIHIGIVGHYSHGKSSLLNALLFPPKTGEMLPTGEGVVTGLCSLIRFSNTVGSHEFYEVDQGGHEKLLSQDEYRARVSGKGKNIGALSHFIIRLNVESLDDALFDDFATKRIELLDTPGLGGPYWSDELALMQWIRAFEITVVCIKATEINEITALTVNPFLRQSLKPCVPVITFWDLWKTSADYKGITDENKARAEAKRKLEQFFAPLSEYLDGTVFVSAKACTEAVEVPADKATHYTEQWNVDNVRRSLASRVRPGGGVIVKKTEESELDTQRRAKVRQLAEQLCGSAIQYANNVRLRIDEYLPEGTHSDIHAEMQDDVQREVDIQIDKLANLVDRHFNQKISALTSHDSFIAERDQAKDAALVEYKEARDRAVKQLLTKLERFKSSRLDPVIKATGLKREAQGRLDREYKRLLEDFSRGRADTDDTSGTKIIELPSAGAEMVTNVLTALKDAFLDVLKRYAILAVAAAVILPTLWWILSWIPIINRYAARIMLVILGFVFVGIGGIIYSRANQAIAKTRNDARNKTLSYNAHAKLVQRITADLGDPLKKVIADVQRLLDEQLAPIDDQTRDVLHSLKTALDTLEDKTHEIKSLL